MLSKENAEKIDIWMLGKSFMRIFYQIFSMNRFPSTIYQRAYLLVEQMTCDAKERISAQDVGDLLWALRDTLVEQTKKRHPNH